MKMNRTHAAWVETLLCQAGYLDDADYFLREIVIDDGKKAALTMAKEFNSLVKLINPLLPRNQKIKLDYVKIVNEIVLSLCNKDA